jgi:hypothetical protein
MAGGTAIWARAEGRIPRSARFASDRAELTDQWLFEPCEGVPRIPR